MGRLFDLTVLPSHSSGESLRIRSAVSGRAASGEGGLAATLRAFWRLQPRGRWRWALIWLLQNVRFAPIYLIPLMTGHLIDQIDRAHPEKVMALIPGIAIGVALLCLGNVLGDTGARYLLARIARGLTASLRMALIRRLDRLGLAFHDRVRLGELEQKFTLDLNRLESFQCFLADSVLMNVTTILVMSAIVFAKSPLLLALIVIGVFCDVVLIKSLWRHLRGAQEGYRRAEGSFMHILNETLLGMRVTRAHATEDFTEGRVRAGAQEVARRGLVLDALNNLFGSSSWAITTMLGVGVIFFGVWLVVAPPVTWHLLGMSIAIQPISLGEYTVLLSYYGILTGSITSVVNNIPSVAGAQDAIGSLSQLYAEDAEEEPIGGDPVPPVRGELMLTGVRFAYPGAASPAIAGVDLVVPAGTSLALVGPSGGGKTTLASLVLGLYRPQGGVIAVDGRDIHRLDLRALRRQCSVVTQDVVLFNDSILANITWGDAHPDEARARHAAAQANALEFIDRLADGLHHRLGDRGVGLSGGQRQRLALARALYRDPRILILDEATSALDSESERLVQKALDQAMRSRTTIVIAHRLSTIRNVDRVAVLARGRVVEQGAYDELVARGGVFAGMVATAAGAVGVAGLAEGA